ncbi:MAG: MFS transporter [Cyanophyceae cyanobacterium]
MNQRSQQRSHLPTSFWLITLVALINSVSFTLIIPLLYPYAKEFGLSDFQASLLTTSYAVSQFIGTPILGNLSDRLGRKPLLVVSLLGSVAANLLASVAGVAWLLFAARILDGLTGGNNSIARAVISDVTTPEQRPKAFGIFGAMFRLGFVVGPALSYVGQQLPTLPGISSLGMSFLIGAGIALIATLLTAFLLPETLDTLDKQGFQLNWQDFVFAKILQSASRPRLGSIFILTLLSGATFTIFTFAFQPFFLNVLDQDAKSLAIVFAAVGMLGFICQVFALEPLSNRFNLVDILFVTLGLRGLLFLMIPTFPDISAFFVIMAAFGCVNSFPLPLINSILSLNSSDREQGEVLGINASYLSLSNAIGPAISGILVSLGYLIPFWVTGILTLFTAWFAFGLRANFKCEKASR